MKVPEVIELEKIKLHQSDISAIIYFLDWCEGSGCSEHTEDSAFDFGARLAHHDPNRDELCDVMESSERIAWRYFGIDHAKVELERRSLLDYQRDLNSGDS